MQKEQKHSICSGGDQQKFLLLWLHKKVDEIPEAGGGVLLAFIGHLGFWVGAEG